MKKVLILTGALMTLIAGLAAAASSGVVNLSWDDCGTFGSMNKSFACNTNTGSSTMVASFISFVPLDSMNGNEVVIEYQVSSATMSPWWQIKRPTDNSPACRNTALTADFNFASNGSCFDFWSGRGAQGGVGIIRNVTQTNRARILVVCAVPIELAGPVGAGTETYSIKLVIDHTKTTGAGACSGCTDGVLFVPQLIKCTQNPGVPPTSAGDQINLGIDKTMETLGTYALSYDGTGICCGIPGATPARNTTWGAVKSLYR